MLKLIVPAVASAVTAAVLALAAPAAQAAPAVSINGTTCGMYDGNGGIAITTDTRILATQSANDNGMLRCQTQVTPPASGSAVRYDSSSTGGFCFASYPVNQVTDQWKETVSASGEATLVCHFSSK